jgi:hypothetical protein
MPGTSGRTSPKLLATYDPATSSWRTSEDISPSVAKKWLRTLPAWGTASTGGLYELPTPALLTSEPDCSSLLPTPTVTDMGNRKTVEEWEAWIVAMKERHGNGNGHGRSLSIEARKLLPTPKANDSTGAGVHGAGGLDLPTTLRSLGETTSPPSAAGSDSSDAPHPTPPNPAPEATSE